VYFIAHPPWPESIRRRKQSNNGFRNSRLCPKVGYRILAMPANGRCIQKREQVRSSANNPDSRNPFPLRTGSKVYVLCHMVGSHVKISPELRIS
jgi:hypothetical protein